MTENKWLSHHQADAKFYDFIWLFLLYITKHGADKECLFICEQQNFSLERITFFLFFFLNVEIISSNKSQYINVIFIIWQ